MKNARTIAVLKVLTIGFKSDGENSFFSHCKKLNVEICVKLGKILMSITIDIKTKKNNIYRLKSEILPKMSKK